MNKCTTSVLILALLATPTPFVKAQSPPAADQPKPKLVAECVVAVIVIGVGCYVVWQVKRFCDRVLGTNAPPLLTNVVPNGVLRLDSASTSSDPMTLQTAPGPNGPWSDCITFSLNPMTGEITASANGSPVATITSTVTNGVRFVNFGNLIPASDSGNFFRLKN